VSFPAQVESFMSSIVESTCCNQITYLNIVLHLHGLHPRHDCPNPRQESYTPS